MPAPLFGLVSGVPDLYVHRMEPALLYGFLREIRVEVGTLGRLQKFG